MASDDSGSRDSEERLKMALTEVARLERRCVRLETISSLLMAAMTPDQLARVRDQLAQLDSGEGTDATAG